MLDIEKKEMVTYEVRLVSPIGEATSWTFREINAVRWIICLGSSVQVIVVAIVILGVAENEVTRDLRIAQSKWLQEEAKHSYDGQENPLLSYKSHDCR